ncbi:MAG: hypothetical protein MJZ20_07510 [Bacteroidaceae bacterium]|nr:hypothetical protein [Bacteroidaceae bacterium]
MRLPDDFVQQMTTLLGKDEYMLLQDALNTIAPTSIRVRDDNCIPHQDIITDKVAWCQDGYYLSERPSFTTDPLLHAGAYYVQEASSMFIAQIVEQYIKKPVTALDLCAAPGGKSTLLLSHLPAGSLLIANEINYKRANILNENISKWAKCSNKSKNDISSSYAIVTNNQASDFAKLGREQFDFVLCDMPCSGEGMFRKDADSIGEWSLKNVMMCSNRQREIARDIWDSLKCGGIMIYSTCTYNTQENEMNVKWIADELGAEILSCHISSEWGITGNLLSGESFPCYHFLPHKTKGEGFFCAILHKLPTDDDRSHNMVRKSILSKIEKQMHVMPLHIYAADVAQCEVDYNTALRFLHGEAITLPQDTPRGIITLLYHSQQIGQVKNIGSRANNLYPKAWRIRKHFT